MLDRMQKLRVNTVSLLLSCSCFEWNTHRKGKCFDICSEALVTKHLQEMKQRKATRGQDNRRQAARHLSNYLKPSPTSTSRAMHRLAHQLATEELAKKRYKKQLINTSLRTEELIVLMIKYMSKRLYIVILCIPHFFV